MDYNYALFSPSMRTGPPYMAHTRILRSLPGPKDDVNHTPSFKFTRRS